MAGRAADPVPADAHTEHAPAGSLPALVWIDSREAIVVRWDGAAVTLERLRSDVPPHRRSTGHVRHDPAVRHGGGGVPQTAGEERRLEHLARFLEAVGQRLPGAGDLILLGPGVVHERLARDVRDRDARHRVERAVRCEVAPRMTRPQLVARLRAASGEPPRRRTVGAYRWTEAPPPGSPREAAGVPRRVSPKRQRPGVPRREEVS